MKKDYLRYWFPQFFKKKTSKELIAMIIVKGGPDPLIKVYSTYHPIQQQNAAVFHNLKILKTLPRLPPYSSKTFQAMLSLKQKYQKIRLTNLKVSRQLFPSKATWFPFLNLAVSPCFRSFDRSETLGLTQPIYITFDIIILIIHLKMFQTEIFGRKKKGKPKQTFGTSSKNERKKKLKT